MPGESLGEFSKNGSSPTASDLLRLSALESVGLAIPWVIPMYN